MKPIIAYQSIPILFKKIIKDQISGLLTAEDPEKVVRKLYFSGGDLIFAQSTRQEERLADILLANGAITRDQYDQIEVLLKKSQTRIGRLLVDQGFITSHDLYNTLRSQFTTIAVSVFSLEAGQFEFETNGEMNSDYKKVPCELSRVIARGVKNIKKIDFFRNRILDKFIIPLEQSDDAIKFLGAKEKEVLEKVILLQQQNCDKISENFKASEFVFWKKLYLFYLLSLMDFGKPEQLEPPAPDFSEIDNIYEKLQDDKLTYYEVLGVNDQSGTTIIKDTYFKLAEKFHPDKVLASAGTDIKKKADFILSRINSAYDILGNPNKKQEYDEKLSQPKSNAEQAFEDQNPVQMAKVYFLKAKTLFKQEQVMEAIKLIQEAIKLDENKANYYLQLGVYQTKVPLLRGDAQKNLQKAADMEVWNADPYFALGNLFLSENNVQQAHKYFSKALERNADHTLAGQKLLEIEPLLKKKSIFSSFFK